MGEATARAAIVIDAPREDVWNALTDPDLLERYFMGARVETDWQVGSPITFSGEHEGTAYRDEGEILAVEPNRLLRFSHWSPLSGTDDTPENHHVVEVLVVGDADGEGSTGVTLTQSNLTGGTTDEDRANRGHSEQTWMTVLQGLKRVVEGRPPRPV